MSYVDVFVVPVPKENRAAYKKLAETASTVFKEHGAIQVIECWGDDLPESELGVSFKSVMRAKQPDGVVFSWVLWPSKEARDEGNERVMDDPRMQPTDDMPFDGERLIYGGFQVLVEK
ncbi:DUF1428 domain-containing protein [Asticcacaulis sp. YBE204]|uniref:DUF1428 domain-containing protein n=1 Tax=Asticcacaulis sp. YBE204 TaxID=1282363 RepID=UPI0003C3D78E|nr:DUF1428 domain-containing protein [Asticcacaulis sp. YBE204]ESQ81093.1 hypothetical protein AEYBE204_01825 [Asticcacaulis sp. YBE204]